MVGQHLLEPRVTNFAFESGHSVMNGFARSYACFCNTIYSNSSATGLLFVPKLTLRNGLAWPSTAVGIVTGVLATRDVSLMMSPDWMFVRSVPSGTTPSSTFPSDSNR